MLFDSLDRFAKITIYFSLLSYAIDFLNKNNFYDDNIEAEDMFGKLLNICYDWNLVNLNRMGCNYPAIDLGDKGSKICVQVTATRKANPLRKKIQEKTLNAINQERALDSQINTEDRLFSSYNRVIIFVIGKKPCFKKEFVSRDIKFGSLDDIMDLHDLLRKIKELDKDRQEKIIDVLSDSIGKLVKVPSGESNLFSWVEERKVIPPVGDIFLFYKYFTDECDWVEYDDFKKYIGKFLSLVSSLPPEAISILSRVIIEGKICGINETPGVVINYSTLRALIDRSIDLNSLIILLLDKKIVSVSDDINYLHGECGVNEYGDPISLKVNYPDLGDLQFCDLFSVLKSYFGNNDAKLVGFLRTRDSKLLEG